MTLSASAGPRFLCLAFSRICAGAPPETILVKRINAIIVAGPHLPSTFMPTDFWNSLTALSVRSPNMPSTRPALNPISVNLACSAATSSPRIIGDG